MTDLLKKLAGGDLRSIGRSNEVVAQVIESPALISELFEGLFHEDARVRARASDALEKVSTRYPDWIKKYRTRLLRDYLTGSDSQIVKVSALQALADLAECDQTLRPSVSRLVLEALRVGSPSLKARARKLRGSMS